MKALIISSDVQELYCYIWTVDEVMTQPAMVAAALMSLAARCKVKVIKLNRGFV